MNLIFDHVQKSFGPLKVVDSFTHEFKTGELTALVGPSGCGKSTLLHLAAGLERPSQGQVLADGKRIPGPHPSRTLVFQEHALYPWLTLRDNVALLGAGARSGFMRWDEVREATSALIGKYDVRARDESLRTRALSGGNQQKLVVGREVEGSRTALVAENPSRGLDVQAAAAVHARIRAARDAGMAVAIYSSDLDEVLSLADRVVVMYAGCASEVPLDHESIGRAMLGLAPR